MKDRILYICLGIMALLGIMLVTYIVKYDPICERVHLDVIDWESIAVPEAEGAQKIAEAYIGVEEGWELQKNPIYDVKVDFNETKNEWIVIFLPRNSENKEERIIGIRKDHGIITEYTVSDNT